MTLGLIGFVLGIRVGFWVKIGFELGLIGFVFPAFTKCLLFIILSIIRGYVHLVIFEIGFVLHNLLLLVAHFFVF